MQIHELKSKIKKKGKKRIARGGKRGDYSGRGNKGQKSRAGRKIRPAERDIILKIPKLSAHKKPILKKEKTVIINLAELEKKVNGEIINKKVLMELGLITNFNQKVKILGSGGAKKAFKIKGLEVSKSAKEKIEKVGGEVK